MPRRSNRKSLFSLSSGSGTSNLFFHLLSNPLEKVLSLKGCDKIYTSASNHKSALGFMRGVLSELNVKVAVSDDQKALIPAEGPGIVVANHPFGAIEGIILAELLCSVRPDVKVMANFLLERIPQMKNLFLSVDPFNKKESVRKNVRPIRDAVRWVQDGHMLMVFPAGEVSHIKVTKREISDPDWNPGIAKIIRRTEAPVLPAFFKGANGPFFQLAGLVHPRLRTAMLAREFVNKRKKSIELKIGRMIPFNRLKQFEKDGDMTDYLRWRTYLLGHAMSPNRNGTKWPLPSADKFWKPIPPPGSAEDLQQEINSLPPDQQLVTSGDYVVWYAEAPQIPGLMNEIGRLREICFRAANEGTGKSLDLDVFDTRYIHLFIWHSRAREIVGAYRLGLTDILLSRFGTSGLYTSTLFRSNRRFFDLIGPALELGRSFVRPEYQRSYAPLLLLWKGIGHFIARRPRYRMLFGPVSISRDYSDLSRQLIATTLLKHSGVKELAAMIRPKTPPRLKPIRFPGSDHGSAQRFCRDMDEVCSVIGEIELGVTGIPILLKHYLNLGGRLLSFNIDKKFGNSMDGLILVDLLQADFKTLRRYFGKNGFDLFYNHHQEKANIRQAPYAAGLLKAS